MVKTSSVPFLSQPGAFRDEYSTVMIPQVLPV